MEFDKKQTNLLNENQFIKEGIKETRVTVSGNSAKKYSTTGNVFVDNFASIAAFKEPRSYAEVAKDMEILWRINPLLCVKLLLYIRMITRKPRIENKEKVEVLETQKGQGLKHEGIMRMLWLAIHQKATFKHNFHLFLAAGSWKDIFQMLSLDLQYHGWDNRKLDWSFFWNIISAGLMNPEHTNLVRKYLPTIRTNNKCTTLEAQADTLIGRWIAKKFAPDYEKAAAYKCYRKLKTNGNAHEWQQLISKQLYEAINFDRIAGRALAKLVGSKFLENHNLTDKYKEWISNKKSVKYTGFVFEMFKPLEEFGELQDYQIATINAQFNQLLKDTKVNSKLLVVVDTSGSMTSLAIGCNMSSRGIAMSMALYFSEFLTGKFANTFAEFSDECILHQWEGNTPVEKWNNFDSFKVGNTNFQSVIDLFITLKEKGVPESDFPEGLLLISDGEFDTSGKDTNFQTAIKRLKEAGFSEKYVNNFKIILWDIPNAWYGSKFTPKFEDFAEAPNFFYMSGYDPAAVSFIMDNTPFKASPKNAKELFFAAMNQSLLNMVKIIKPHIKKKPINKFHKKNFKKKK